MAIRQYIGARYVPRFTGLYDATQIYDALDVVDNGSGTSYIAKKTVPAGTALTDTEYWFVYGASSGAIYDLQTRMGNAENDITALDGRVDTNEDDISFLKNRIDPLRKNRHVVCIGDSYAADTSGWDGWITQFIDNWWGSTYGHGIAAPGGGWVIGSESYTFQGALQHIEASLASIADDIEDIVVMGGYNDMSSNTTEASILLAMNNFKTYCASKYPNAKITVAFIGFSYSSKTNMDKCIDYGYIWERCAAHVGFRFVTNMKYCLLYTPHVFISEGNPNSGYHPSTTGNAYVARKLAEYLTSLECEVYIITNFLSRWWIEMKNGTVQLTAIDGANLVNAFFINRSFPYATWVEAQDWSTIPLGWGSGRYTASGRLSVFVDNDTLPPAIFAWKYEAGKLYLKNLCKPTTITWPDNMGVYTSLENLTLGFEIAY